LDFLVMIDNILIIVKRIHYLFRLKYHSKIDNQLICKH
jgi:hypothetical protein